MWVFTRYGFLSIACASKPGGKIDESTVMVRARQRQHLENLQKRFPESELGKAEILDFVGTDYGYRLIISKSAWISILTELAMEQTWSNFKNETSRFTLSQHGSSQYPMALHRVWETMNELQSSEKPRK